ncbi:MAG TPA: hypothetical protein VJU13_01015, partial [Candidatus Nitrosocosmicus sp.]|nr:hypothetical protein [Candidatus Nitrosocosmicus sp.]
NLIPIIFFLFYVFRLKSDLLLAKDQIPWLSIKLTERSAMAWITILGIKTIYSAYIALFVAVSNWITIQYKFVIEQVPILDVLFSNL